MNRALFIVISLTFAIYASDYSELDATMPFNASFGSSYKSYIDKQTESIKERWQGVRDGNIEDMRNATEVKQTYITNIQNLQKQADLYQAEIAFESSKIKELFSVLQEKRGIK
ncbi:MAG: hypothetical protein LBG67_02320 [Campylobacteraceae bacterium]|jgi:predicted XRE-type DNA-binding protein|nr:hypothetical protein [Campylobacteraceae bacterium]